MKQFILRAVVLLPLIVNATGSADNKSADVQIDALVERPLIAYADSQMEEINRIAMEQGIPMAPEYGHFFQRVQAREWVASSNAFRNISAKFIGHRDPAIVNGLWPPTMELFGAIEQFLIWEPELLDEYANEIMKVVPSDAIFFGGTDPGRFVFVAYEEASTNKSFFVITQNALADATYAAYERKDPRNAGIWLPSKEDGTRAFHEFTEGCKAGKYPECGDLVTAGGKVQVRGVKAVMAINGLIVKQIFEHNRDTHEFYVEESYAIPWMVPYLEPCGPIMKLNAHPTPLTPEMVAADMKYWAEYSNRLLSNDAFKNNPVARKTISKLRTAHGGLYAAREMPEEAETAFRQGLALDELNPECNVRFSQLMADQEHVDEAIAHLEDLMQKDPGLLSNEGFMRHVEKIRSQKAVAKQPVSEPK
jgi:hypothetical protein